MTILASACLAAALARADALTGLDTAPAPSAAEPAVKVPPGLHLPPDAVLPEGGGLVMLQGTFEGNYPLTEALYARGLVEGFELDLRGIFHHQKVVGFGESWTYDFDEGQALARWGVPTGLPGNAGATAAAGYTRFYTRQRISDGRYSYWMRQFAIVEAMTGASTPQSGGRLVIAARGLRDLDFGNRLAAVIAGAETPPLGRLTVLGDVAFFLENPEGWRRPWAAGVRFAQDRYALTGFVSNTWGTTAVDGLDGTRETFIHARWSMVF